ADACRGSVRRPSAAASHRTQHRVVDRPRADIGPAGVRLEARPMNIGSAPHWPSGLTVDDERLLARIPHDRLAINGIPTEERIRARERAAEVVRRSLPELLDSATLHASPLGVAWSNDTDVFAAAVPDREMVV